MAFVIAKTIPKCTAIILDRAIGYGLFKRLHFISQDYYRYISELLATYDYYYYHNISNYLHCDNSNNSSNTFNIIFTVYFIFIIREHQQKTFVTLNTING